MSALLLVMNAALALEPLPPELAQTAPADFRLDGDLREWLDIPQLTLGRLQQVSGDKPVGGPDDYLLQGWWAWTDDGLLVAGEVRDDVLLFAKKAEDLQTSDAIALWISLPAPEFPVLGFEDEAGSHPLDQPGACSGVATVEDKGACESWVAAQSARRVALSRLFTRRYLLTPLGVAESFAGSCAPEPVESAKPGSYPCPDSEIRVIQHPNGWTFEARIGRGALPATTELPLSHVRLMAEAIDNDEGLAGQESVMSLSKTAVFGDPSTFPSFTLDHPLSTESSPPVLTQLLAANPEPSLLYFPGRRLDRAWILENLAQANVAAPTNPSPALTPVAYGALPVVGTLGDLTVYNAPDGGLWCQGCPAPRRLITMREGQLVADTPIGAAQVKAVLPRGEGLHILLTEDGRASALGTGDCGTCAQHRLAVIELGQDGRLTQLFEEELIEGKDPVAIGDDTPFLATAVSAVIAPDGASLSFTGQRLDATNLPSGPFAQIWRWDPSEDDYLGEGED